MMSRPPVARFLKAIEGIEGHNAEVRRALAVVDREEGAAENVAAQGIKLAAIFKKSDFPGNFVTPGTRHGGRTRGRSLPPKNQNTIRPFFSPSRQRARTRGTHGGAIQPIKTCA